MVNVPLLEEFRDLSELVKDSDAELIKLSIDLAEISERWPRSSQPRHTRPGAGHANHPILRRRNVITIGSGTIPSYKQMGEYSIQEALRILRGGKQPRILNPEVLKSPKLRARIRLWKRARGDSNPGPPA